MKRFDVELCLRLTAHHPFLGDNDGHPVGLSLFENDIAVLKFANEEDMSCRKKKVWPACLPNKVSIQFQYVRHDLSHSSKRITLAGPSQGWLVGAKL